MTNLNIYAINDHCSDLRNTCDIMPDAVWIVHLSTTCDIKSKAKRSYEFIMICDSESTWLNNVPLMYFLDCLNKNKMNT